MVISWLELVHLPTHPPITASGGKVRFRNRFSEYLNLNARFGSAFGGDQARSNAKRKIEPEVKISVTSTANENVAVFNLRPVTHQYVSPGDTATSWYLNVIGS
ncbi:hypothetical protein C8J57DRAFT_1240789 [Mycena rebaudengoi]|nr:hypothetical protein C8J57DRAFT_1240789 [Mycena rebaudengoi]